MHTDKNNINTTILNTEILELNAERYVLHEGFFLPNDAARYGQIGCAYIKDNIDIILIIMIIGVIIAQHRNLL